MTEGAVSGEEEEEETSPVMDLDARLALMMGAKKDGVDAKKGGRTGVGMDELDVQDRSVE